MFEDWGLVVASAAVLSLVIAGAVVASSATLLCVCRAVVAAAAREVDHLAVFAVAVFVVATAAEADWGVGGSKLGVCERHY